MKNIFTVLMLTLCILFVGAGEASAQYSDDDGQLIASWFAPTVGNPASHYLLSYEINGVLDSITVVTPNLEDSSAVLTVLGDYAVVHIRAVSIKGDISVPMVSDTARYFLSTDINPPTWNTWK